MGKTIKEKTTEYAVIFDENSPRSHVDIDKAKAYFDGANMVLEEIHKALYKHIAYKDTFYDVLNKVKELKGE